MNGKRWKDKKEITYWCDGLLGRSDGFGECEEGEGKVDESVLVLLKFLFLDKFEQLDAHETGHERRSSDHRRNNLSCNTLGLKETS